MIRLAIDDSNTDLQTDTTLLQTEVTTRSGPNPPNESVESIGQRVADPNFICMIDDLAGEAVPVGYHTVAGFYVVTEGNPEAPVAEARGPHVIVIWWLPREELERDNMVLLIAVFAEACREVLRRHPGGERWPIYGDYLGAGETEAEQDASSEALVTEWTVFWNQVGSPVSGFAKHKLNPQNQNQHRSVGTVGEVVQFADWLAAERQP